MNVNPFVAFAKGSLANAHGALKLAEDAARIGASTGSSQEARHSAFQIIRQQLTTAHGLLRTTENSLKATHTPEFDAAYQEIVKGHKLLIAVDRAPFMNMPTVPPSASFNEIADMLHKVRLVPVQSL